MKIRSLILFGMGGLCLLAPVQSFAIIIPLDRTINWTPGAVTGVIGGIPNRTTIYKNLVTDLGADPTGVTNCSDILTNAINTCPANQVVYLPAGTFRINSRVLIQFKGNFSIRGAGMGLTTLMAYTNGAEPLFFGTSDYPRPTANITITAGATKGSNIVTCSNTSSVVVGKVVRIEQTDPTWVKPLNGGAINGPNANMSALFKVVSKTPTTVNFSPALPWTLTNSPKIASLPTLTAQNVGIENLTIDMANANCLAAVTFVMSSNCWMKGVEIKNAPSRQVFLNLALNFEMRRCYVHDGRANGPGSEGIDFYEGACWSLVEDNIVSNIGVPIVLGDSQGGCTGNVIAYNYIPLVRTGNGIAGMSICDNHGPHNSMNLIEGNVAQSFESDGYKGSSSHGTLFRNWLSGNFTGQPDNAIKRAVALRHYANYYNIVGNVLGYPGSTAAYDIEVNGYNGYGANDVVYQLGYPNSGNTGYSGTIAATTPPDYTAEPNNITIAPERLDYNVKSTLLRHGNYVYAADWNRIEWDSAISDHNIPASMYRTARPAWWAPNIAWPPIGPDRTPMVSEIPAQIRFRTLAVPPPNPPRNLRVVP